MCTMWWNRTRIDVLLGPVLMALGVSGMTWRAERHGGRDKPPAAVPGVTVVERCVRIASGDSVAVWHEAAGPVRFAVVWNARFQSHELLWMNAGRAAVHVRFDVVAPEGIRTGGTRRLASGERESLPGQSVTLRPDGRVCVRAVTRR